MQNGGETEKKRVSGPAVALLLTALFLAFGLGIFLGRAALRREGGYVVLSAREALPAPASAAVPEKEPPPPVDINSAPAEELEQLPGVGPALARRIVAYRETEGAFRYPYEIMNVPGIAEKKYEELREHITAG